MPVVTKFAALLAAPVILAAAPAAHAQQARSPLVYAGYAFAGNYENRTGLYPYSAELAEEESGKYFDRVLTEHLHTHPQAAARLLGDQANGKLDQNAVAFALVQESVERQRMDGKVWTILTLHANILAFNRQTRSIVAAYPVRLRMARAAETAPTHDELKEWVRSAYAGGDSRANIFDLWLDHLPTMDVRAGATKHLRVTEVSFAPEAESVVVAEHLNPAAMRNQLANAFEASVAEAGQLSIIPNSVGEAIGNKMACRFPNGAAMSLTLPPADFELTLKVRGFANAHVDKAAYQQQIYRVRAAVKLHQPDLNDIYLDENVYETQIVTLPRDARMEIDPWQQYYKTLQLLMTGLSMQMVKSDDHWLAENATRGADAKPAFLKTNALITTLK